ncbi:MAG: 30S ribosomal protein S16 [Anaerolineales bacterium]|nr:30S ribosomal protein S16 [Anaerolineales bacterium]
MLKIRLSRRGKKKQPTYRVVVADVESKRDGRYVELIGWYNPLTNPASFRIDEGRALHWLSVGAQPTDAVNRLLKNQGTLERLPRVHKGESIEAQVAEFEGRSLEEEAAAEEAAAEEKSTVEAVVEAVEEVIEEAAETVEEAAEAVAEAISSDDEEAAEADADEADEKEQA